MTYFIQDLIHPYAYLDDLRIDLFKDLNIDTDLKLQALDYLVLNVWFDFPEKQVVNLGLAYYTLRQYFQENEDFLVIDDPNFSLREEVLANISQMFPSLQLKIPFLIESPPKEQIIQSIDDFQNGTKILNTALYLTLKYCRPNLDSINCDFGQIQSVGRSL
jgi:hypothetical protein